MNSSSFRPEPPVIAGYARYVRSVRYSRMYTIYPPALDIAREQLRPTCKEEAEALMDAPPMAGMWASKPTIKQRVNNWTDCVKWTFSRKAKLNKYKDLW